jgi:mannose-6-phosphate isomerase-like protein (cupin superfamily)
MSVKTESKIWGSVRHLFCDHGLSVSTLEVLPQVCCSRHTHQQRANHFAIISGLLIIEWWHAEDAPPQQIALAAGESFTVPSKVLHRFRSCSLGKLVEVYWPDDGGTVDLADIQRVDAGHNDDEATEQLWRSIRDMGTTQMLDSDRGLRILRHLKKGTPGA